MVRESRSSAANTPASAVWLLAASTGGLRAVSQFLAKVRPTPGTGFVYAQHIEVTQVNQLVNMVERRSQWRAEVANAGSYVAEGFVTVVSPGEKISIGRDRFFRNARQPWSGLYRPNIDDICSELAACYQHHSGMIVFTGMGEDGVAGSKAIKAGGGSVWIQDPATCIAPALPEAVITDGEYDCSADIDALSRKFNRRLNTKLRRPVLKRSLLHRSLANE
jgi:chemosensory pili system protein ChpB (putative protein-glutamate methylesterase)